MVFFKLISAWSLEKSPVLAGMIIVQWPWYISGAWQPPSSRLIANSLIVGCFLAFVRWRFITAVHLNIGVMRDATFFPVIPHFLADKGIWIFAPNVATRADIAPSRQHFFHFHLRILSLGALACRIKKAQKGSFRFPKSVRSMKHYFLLKSSSHRSDRTAQSRAR